jgi:DNA-binding NtrC family response regulator
MARERTVFSSDGSNPPSARRVRTSDGPGGSVKPRPRILLADPDPQNHERFWTRLALMAELTTAKDGSEIEDALISRGPFQLVVASAKLPEPSALQVLARVRRVGIKTPFIVVSSVHQNHLRVFVSDTEGTVLSSRMVDADNLTMLVTGLIESGR